MTPERIAFWQKKKWTRIHNCFYWFRRIQQAEYGRRVTARQIPKELLKQPPENLAAELERLYGWRQTDTPRDGDAAFMSQRKNPHHIGTVVVLGGQPHILHALEGVGMVLSDRLDLRMNFWKIHGYWSAPPCR